MNRYSLLLLLLLTLFAAALAQSDAAMKKFEQILPRGRISAINTPVYIPADQADIAPGSWVLGVLIEGQARAYSLNLLNSHEVVNDRVMDTPYAAVW